MGLECALIPGELFAARIALDCDGSRATLFVWDALGSTHDGSFLADGVKSIPQTQKTRNRRSVWTIATEPFSGAHFATFPRKLIEPCILAGTSAKGCCPSCGAPWERVVERGNSEHHCRPGCGCGHGEKSGDQTKQDWSESWKGYGGFSGTARDTGTWRPTCDCDAGDPIPCTVLDPFLGSGTTACVAIEHGRAWVGCELNAEYAKIAEQRIAGAREKLGLFAEVGM